MYVINRKSQNGRIFLRCAKSRSYSGGVTTLDDAVVSELSIIFLLIRQRSRLARLSHD